MFNRGYQQYSIAQVETAPRGELVVMLYNGAIKFLNKAKLDLEAKNLEGVHNNLLKAQGVISELAVTLDMNTGEVAQNLSRLYEYMNYRLVEANCRKEVDGIDEVLRLLRELLPAWEEAVRQTKHSGAGLAVATAGLQCA